MTIAKITKEQLSKAVQVSNAIEGYKPVATSIKTKVKKMMEKNSVKVSSKR